jgi:hypothetical protein
LCRLASASPISGFIFPRFLLLSQAIRRSVCPPQKMYTSQKSDIYKSQSLTYNIVAK